MQVLKERPPFVTFETRSIEDREATIAAGHYVGRDVDFAFITPAGSKDRIERIVVDWFAQLPGDVEAGRLPADWFDSYKRSYQAFKEGRELPPDGFPVINWPGLGPSVVKTLLSLNLRAVEDVANANEETLARIGMGARALKQRAIDFLATAKNVGAVAERASATKVENESLVERNKALEAKVAALSAQVAALTPQTQGEIRATYTNPDHISADDLGLGKKL